MMKTPLSLAKILAKARVPRAVRMSAVALMATMCMTSLSQGQVLTSISDTAPSGPVIASQTGFVSGLSWTNTGTGTTPLRDVGQSFLVTSNTTLNQITLMLGGHFTSSSATSVFTVTLYSASLLTTPPPSATVVSTQTGTFAFTSSSGGSGTFLTFDVADVALTSGLYYTFMLSLNNASANNTVTVEQNTASSYSDGYRWTYDGTSYTSSTTGDLTFYAIAATPVPEPRTAMLIAASMGFLLLCRCRRRKVQGTAPMALCV